MKIQVLGWFNKGNVGDEAYKLAFPLVLPGHDISFVEYPDDAPDLVILGGGDVVYGAFTDKIRRLPPDIPRVVASVTLTSESDFDFLASAREVRVRDSRSLALAHDRGVAHAEYAPDFAFALVPDPTRGRELIRTTFDAGGLDLYEKVVVVVVSAYLLHAGPDDLARDFQRFLHFSQGLAAALDDTNASAVFLPFGTRPPVDDRAANAFVAARCKWYKKNHVCHRTVGVQDALDVIAAADAVVSSRLHSTIFATLAGTPLVDVTHHDKNRGFLETHGLTDLSVPYWDFSASDARVILGGGLAGGDGRLQDITNHNKQMLNDLRLL